MQKHVGNLLQHLLCMHLRVWILKSLPCKRNSNSYIEVLQMLCNDLDSFNDPYVVCCKLWNGLKPPGSSTGVWTACCFKWEISFVILMLQKCEKCLDSFYMMYWMCLDHRFEWNCSLFENSMVTCFEASFGTKERNKRKQVI